MGYERKTRTAAVFCLETLQKSAVCLVYTHNSCIIKEFKISTEIHVISFSALVYYEEEVI